MKLLAESPEGLDLERLIKEEMHGDYIYMYPPRQAYRPIDREDLAAEIRTSLSRTAGQLLNLYLHFPFCRQICGFCNLYSVATRPDEPYSEYVDLIIRELDKWAPYVANRSVDTVYLGGGTPSILPVHQLERCLAGIEQSLGASRSSIPEIAIEVAPDTVDAVKLKELREIGITRVNLGLQTTSDEGLHQIGRRHGFALARGRIEDALSSGFDNVCIDVIYGLPGQDSHAWQAIVRDVLAFGAPTVCAYPLTLRPNTGFSRHRLTLSGHEQYQKYEHARRMLTNSGYVQETHVRYVVPGVGGYRQKVNHWACQDILGIGAGARGYLYECDYRNGYSIRRRRSALTEYYERMSGDDFPFNSGVLLTKDERMRRQVILGLLNLDRRHFKENFEIDPIDAFARQFSELERLELIDVSSESLRLNERGRKFRDLLVQMFFSPEVWHRIQEFDYAE